MYVAHDNLHVVLRAPWIMGFRAPRYAFLSSICGSGEKSEYVLGGVQRTGLCRRQHVVQISAACFTADSRAFVYGDKFGDIFGCRAHATEGAVVHMLGHYCSVITTLCVDSGNRCTSRCTTDTCA